MGARRGNSERMPTGRPILNIALDEQTHDHFIAFCDTQGVTCSALVEAFARHVDTPEASKQNWLNRLVVEARQIAADRRRRRNQ